MISSKYIPFLLEFPIVTNFCQKSGSLYEPAHYKIKINKTLKFLKILKILPKTLCRRCQTNLKRPVTRLRRPMKTPMKIGRRTSSEKGSCQAKILGLKKLVTSKKEGRNCVKMCKTPELEISSEIQLTVWKLQNFSVGQISREIKIG